MVCWRTPVPTSAHSQSNKRKEGSKVRTITKKIYYAGEKSTLLSRA